MVWNKNEWDVLYIENSFDQGVFQKTGLKSFYVRLLIYYYLSYLHVLTNIEDMFAYFYIY